MLVLKPQMQDVTRNGYCNDFFCSGTTDNVLDQN